MNEQLKKRLIGAVVLVALAAIFIPMLFNGGEETEMPTFGSNVPDKPDQQIQTIEVPLQVAPAQNVDTRPVTTEQEAAETQAQMPPPAAANEPAVPAVPPVATAPEPKPAAKPATPPKPAASAPKPAVDTPASGWVVQLGSFGKAANAIALRDKVRKKGHAAFVEQQKAAAGTIYRVRVGPEIKRENADILKVKLEKAGFNGVVMPHP